MQIRPWTEKKTRMIALLRSSFNNTLKDVTRAGTKEMLIRLYNFVLCVISDNNKNADLLNDISKCVCLYKFLQYHQIW